MSVATDATKTGNPPPLGMLEGADPLAATDAGSVYTKDVSSRTELFYIDDTGAKVQITSAGAMNAAAQGGQPIRFHFPGVLNTSENAYIGAEVYDHAVTITKLAAFVKTPSVGASIIVTFKKITLSTGALSASIGTVTILAAAYTGSTVVSVALATTEGLVMEITQTGSGGTEGSDLTGWAIVSAS